MIPVRLEMENFFSHKNSSIDFSRFDSCLLIGNTEGDYDKSNDVISNYQKSKGGRGGENFFGDDLTAGCHIYLKSCSFKYFIV